MTTIAIIGASGYTGGELSRILLNHPDAEITAVTSRQHDGKKLSEVFPHLRAAVNLTCENLSLAELSERAELFFAAVPHKTAMEMVPQLLDRGKKVIDLSADFRLRDAAVYQQWYQPHTAIEYIGRAVYGLPELYRDELRSASLVANPGCYPTSIILALAPLLRAGAVDPETIIIDSKSGASGAGRGAAVATLFCEVSDGFRPYKVGDHRHTPEIEQELSVLAGRQVTVSFTPHLLPLSRGILSTIYATLDSDFDSDRLRQLYDQAYAAEPFIRLLHDSALPATQHVRGSNYCDIGFKVDRRTNRLVVMSAIDNIVKGASGQAVQNMNILCGHEETAGLTQAPFFP